MPAKDPTTVTNNKKPVFSGNFFLLSSNFKEFNDNIINCSRNNIYLLHSLCTYTDITQITGKSGCIYFSCQSSIVQDRFCSVKCCTTESGLHSYTYIHTETQKNFVNLSSLYQCGDSKNGDGTLSHSYGNKTFISTNISNTMCKNEACFYFGAYGAKINYCYFMSNQNHYDYCKYMYGFAVPDSFITQSIFKNNSFKNGDYGTLLEIILESNLIISECIFLENILEHTFVASERSSLSLINCIVDRFLLYYDIAIIQTSKIKTNKLKLELSFLSLKKCQGKNPFIFEYPLTPSIKKKKRFPFILILESFLHVKK